HAAHSSTTAKSNPSSARAVAATSTAFFCAAARPTSCARTAYSCASACAPSGSIASNRVHVSRLSNSTASNPARAHPSMTGADDLEDPLALLGHRRVEDPLVGPVGIDDRFAALEEQQVVAAVPCVVTRLGLEAVDIADA